MVLLLFCGLIPAYCSLADSYFICWLETVDIRIQLQLKLLRGRIHDELNTHMQYYVAGARLGFLKIIRFPEDNSSDQLISSPVYVTIQPLLIAAYYPPGTPTAMELAPSATCLSHRTSRKTCHILSVHSKYDAFSI